jgi:hypothetical protein
MVWNETWKWVEFWRCRRVLGIIMEILPQLSLACSNSAVEWPLLWSYLKVQEPPVLIFKNISKSENFQFWVSKAKKKKKKSESKNHWFWLFFKTPKNRWFSKKNIQFYRWLFDFLVHNFLKSVNNFSILVLWKKFGKKCSYEMWEPPW